MLFERFLNLHYPNISCVGIFYPGKIVISFINKIYNPQKLEIGAFIIKYKGNYNNLRETSKNKVGVCRNLQTCLLKLSFALAVWSWSFKGLLFCYSGKVLSAYL